FGSAAPTLIVGAGPTAQRLVALMNQLPEYGLRPVGLVDDKRPPPDEPNKPGATSVPYLGRLTQFADIAAATKAEEVIVAMSSVSDDRLAQTAHVAISLGMRVRVVPRLKDAVGVSACVEHLGPMPLVVLYHVDPLGWQFAVKHIMDRLVSGIGLLVISPLFIALAITVKLSSPGPIFFRQRRVGRDGKPFDCLKFRSMRLPGRADEDFELGHGDAPGGVEGVDRRTRIGKFMRRTSLDELPQLINVLRGDMSLVGPRPERPEFVELFNLQIRRYGERQRVRAGMTGWSQVHGLRGQTSIADRAEFDNYYIENWTLTLDLKILALTALAVLRRSED
ncbi:MAG: exopolysaccharide biosynthesis polyprenyl glycosylphosphotransferase, partial [Mycobacterium sp.]